MEHDKLPFLSSSKLQGVDTAIDLCLKDKTTTKVIVFSLFVEQLRAIEYMCKKKGLKVLVFDGKLDKDKKENVLETFKTDKECKILVMSLECRCCIVQMKRSHHIEIICSDQSL